ncbi:MAG: toxic anion resistance protein, partial [Pseudomonadota bacterium]|nr:toxic anion resistance protein [Pseudomonadota bacterium]
MATQSDTATATELNLTPPEPIPTVDVEKAVGLVPVDEGKKTELDSKVDSFVADLIAHDTRSPEFSKRVDEISNMGRKEIAAASSMSNRFLDR